MVVPVIVNAVVVSAVMRPWAVGADAPDMVVVADLGRADVAFVTNDLFAVLAQQAVHRIVACKRLFDPLDESIDQKLMVVEVGRLDDLDLRMGFCSGISPVVDAPDQDSGEQEIGKDNDPPVSQLDRVGEA